MSNNQKVASGCGDVLIMMYAATRKGLGNSWYDGLKQPTGRGETGQQQISLESEIIIETNVMYRLAEAYPKVNAHVKRAIAREILKADLYDSIYYMNPQSQQFYSIVNPLFEKEEQTERSSMHIFSDKYTHLNKVIEDSYEQLKAKLGESRMNGKGFFSGQEYEISVRNIAYVIYKCTTKEVTAQDAIVAATYIIKLNLAKELDQKIGSAEQKEYLQQAINEFKTKHNPDQPDCLILRRLEDSLSGRSQLNLPFSEINAA